MLKSQLVRTLLKWILAIAIVMAVLGLDAEREAGSSPLPAKVSRECAPWDGAAFTISIPLGHSADASIDISIWQAPEFAGSLRFSFPDETGRAGTALYRPAVGDRQPLDGWVALVNANTDHPIEGTFNLATRTGSRFQGRFEATWGSEAIYCG